MDRAHEVLREVFGYDTFRGHQAAAIETVLAGGDAVVLMPTGGGKSLVYQVPALVRDGVGVVVSPLIALMQDQVDALLQLGVRAAYLNSTLGGAEADHIEREFLEGRLDLLYLAPERLLMPGTLSLLDQTRCTAPPVAGARHPAGDHRPYRDPRHAGDGLRDALDPRVG